MDQTIKETGAKLPDPPWLPQLEKRLRPHVLFAREYVHKHNHGTPGHINLVAIDALSTMLGAAHAENERLQQQIRDLIAKHGGVV